MSLSGWKADGEAAAGGGRVGFDFTVDTSCESAGERESEASAGAAGGGCCCSADAGVEDAFLLVAVHAGTVVFDLVTDSCVRAVDCDEDAAGGVAAGGLDDGLKDAFGEIRIDSDPERFLGFRHLERDLPLVCETDAGVGGCVSHRGG